MGMEKVLDTREKLIGGLESLKPPVSFDIETTGLNSRTDALVGCSVADAESDFYIPLRHKEGQNLDLAVFEEIFVPFLMKQDFLLTFNAKFDWFFIRRDYGIDFKFLDVMPMRFVLDPNLRKGEKRDLKLLTELYLKRKVVTYEEVVGPRINFSYLPVKDAVAYGCADARNTYDLWVYFKNLLGDRFDKLIRLDSEMMRVLAFMEYYGFPFDKTEAEILKNKHSLALRQTINELRREGSPFAKLDEKLLNSPDKCGKVLKESGVEGLLDKDGEITTNKNTLNSLREKYPIIDTFITYREQFKLLNSYLLPTKQTAKRKSLVDCADKEGRIHASFIQCRVPGGRLTCAHPNLQQIPEDVRSMFVAPDGYYFIAADYSMIELLLGLAFSGEWELVKMVLKGRDLHKYVASMIFGVPESQIDKGLRDKTKTLEYGMMYGMSPWSLAYKINVSPNEGREIYRKVFNFFGKMVSWREGILADGAKTHTSTTMLGCVRYYPEMDTGDKKEYEKGLRGIINTTIQGSAAEVLKIGLVRLFKRLNGREDVKMVLTVHDDVMLEVKQSVPVNEVAEILTDAMCFQLPGSTPFKVYIPIEIKVGHSWGSLKKYCKRYIATPREILGSHVEKLKACIVLWTGKDVLMIGDAKISDKFDSRYIPDLKLIFNEVEVIDSGFI